MNYTRRKGALVALCCAILFATSCVDLSEVSKFASQSTEARSSLAALVNDFKGTCERMNSFAPAGGALQPCSKYDSISSGTLAAQDVLLKYVGALGTLSSDKTITFEKDLSALPGQVKGAGMDDAQVSAVTTLASKLADAAISGYRRKEISRLVEDTNQNVQAVTTALIKIVGTDYEQLLSNEDAAMDSYYNTALKEEGEHHLLDSVLVKNLFHQQRTELIRRKSAADAYVTIMKHIAAGHQKLYDQRSRFNVKELVETLSPDIDAIGGATENVYKAFK